MTDRQKKVIKPAFWTIFSISTICLGCSLVVEFLAGLDPCKLCLGQRYTYLCLACLSGLGIFLPTTRFIPYAISLLLLAGLVVAFYQSLAFAGLVNMKCHATPTAAFDPLAFKEGLRSTTTCSEPIISIAGIPITWINILIYSGLALVLYKALPQKPNERREMS